MININRDKVREEYEEYLREMERHRKASFRVNNLPCLILSLMIFLYSVGIITSVILWNYSGFLPIFGALLLCGSFSLLILGISPGDVEPIESYEEFLEERIETLNNLFNEYYRVEE